MTGLTAATLSVLGAAEETQREHMNPYLVGVSTFVFFVLCLSFVLLFNRDR
jgi:hypothetical protein